MCDCKSKIAPPTEEEMSENSAYVRALDCIAEYPGVPETTIIEHDQWGRVEGVKENIGAKGWKKTVNDVSYFYAAALGWREVKPKRWVPVGVDISERSLAILDGSGTRLLLPGKHRWKTVEIEREEKAE